MDTGFGATQLYSACRLTLTHYYEPNDYTPKPLFGTGFLVEFPEPDNRLGLITNRHLVDIPWAKPEREGTTIKSIKVEMWQSRSLRIAFMISDPKPKPLYHDDESIDIAVIPFIPEMDPTIPGALYDKIENVFPDLETDTLMFHHGLSWQYLLTCEELWPQLEAGEFVSFPGYPMWYDRLQTRPVLRSGVIASDPQTNYRFHEGEPTNTDGNQQVLFDAFSTNGNSGSPVFVAQRGIPPFPLQIKTGPDDSSPRTAAQLAFSGYHRSFLIGINAGHFNDLDSDWPDDHAGLSRMHKLSAIMEILRANESEPDPEARKINFLVAKPDSAEDEPSNGDDTEVAPSGA
jgi:hypothetical protein